MALDQKLNDQKIAISGNRNYGLAKALSKVVEADFFSRLEGDFDLTLPKKRRELAEVTLGYDVFINCSALWQFHQVLLLEQIFRTWKERGHSGYIISLGSTADTPVKGTEWVYPIEKKALRAYSRNLSFAALGGHGSKPSGIRVTYLSPGYLDTPSMEKKFPDVKKLDTDYVASIVLWLLRQPPHVNISEICVDPIQMGGASGG